MARLRRCSDWRGPVVPAALSTCRQLIHCADCAGPVMLAVAALPEQGGLAPWLLHQ